MEAADGRVENCVYGDNFTLSENGRRFLVDGRTHVPLVNSLVQWTRAPLSPRRPFFEVTLLSNLDRDQFMMVGTNPDDASCPPAWNLARSIRYRSLEGGVFRSGAGLRSDYPWGRKNDTVRVQLEKSFPDKSLLNFCLNGKLVYRQWVNVEPSHLYPAVGVDRGPVQFKVAWPGSDPIRCTPLRLHCMSSWIGFRHISRNDDTNELQMLKQDDKPRLGYNRQAPRPLDKDDSYFEVEILTRWSETTGPAIGLTPAWTSKFQYPGWKPDTIGYLVPNGGVCNEWRDASATPPNDSQRACNIGDRVGCGVIYDGDVGKDTVRDGQTVMVYFTKNGELVYTRARRQPDGGFYPTVGLYHPGEKVKVSLSCDPPPIAAELRDKLRHWAPIYRNFRFSEAMSFGDVDTTSPTETIMLEGSDDVPRMIQQVNITSSGPGELYYFSVQVETIGDKGEIQLGTAPSDVALHGELLEVARVRRVGFYTHTQVEVNGAVYTNTYKQGDTIGCCVEQVTPGETWTRFALNGRYIGTSETFHDANTHVHPTICLCKGPISLKVLWADNENAKKSFPCLSVFAVTAWGRPSSVHLEDRTLTLQSVDDSDIVYNVVGPSPVSNDDKFLVQVRHVASDTDAPTKFMFPGIGVTSGTCPFVRSASMMLTDSTCVLFFGTAQQLIIPGKGAKESEKKRKRQMEVKFQTIGCSLTINDDKCILQFFCDGEFEIGHEVDIPTGGVFPVLCFQKGCEGHKFEVDVEERSPCELNADVLNSDVPNIYDFGSTIYGWDRMMDLPFPVLADDIANITAEEMRPVTTTTSDKISTINNIFLSHCPIDSPRIEALISALKFKGYCVQTTGWTTEMAKEKQMQIDMSEVVLCCLSPSACTDRAQAAEIKHVCSKKIPILPVMLELSPWPPDGLQRRFAATFRSYNDLLLDFTDKDTTANELKLIEESLQKAVDMAASLKKSKKVDSKSKKEEKKKHESYNNTNNNDVKRSRTGSSSSACSLS